MAPVARCASGAGAGGVFISYRRGDSCDIAGRLSDSLVRRFGVKRVFIDVETIEPGTDFAGEITRAVAASAVLVAVIGPGWLSACNARGRRLDDPDDWVRAEISTALARGTRVIPVLVRGAVLPGRDELPADLAGLARRAALPVRHDTFRDDVRRLVAAVKRALAEPPPARERGGLDLATRTARLLREAERLANSATDQASRAWALTQVAKALISVDRSRVAWLFTDAERAANSITDEPSRAGALRRLAAAVASIEPDRAERIASSITDAHSKDAALGDAAEVIAATDLCRAERMAEAITDADSKAAALCAIVAAIAATRPDQAERIANSITQARLKLIAGVSAASRRAR